MALLLMKFGKVLQHERGQNFYVNGGKHME